MTNSKKSKYKQSIRFYLIKAYKWEIKEAIAWVKNNKEYLDELYENGSSVRAATRIISKMKRED